MRHIHLGIGHSVVLTMLIAVIACGSATDAVELSGVVQRVMGEKIAIRIAPNLLPNPGDKVEVLNTVPDLGDIALDCEWQVESVQEDVVLAVTRDKSRATAQPDYKAVIYSPNPRRIGLSTTEGKPGTKEPSAVSETPDKTPPVVAGIKGDDKERSVAPSDEKQPTGDVPAGMVLMDKGLFGDGTAVPESTPSFDDWLKSEEGRKAAEAATDKGMVAGDGSSQVILDGFEKPPPAAGGVTLDDFVRVNQGLSDPDEFSRQLVIPPDLEAQEPWVTQWQAYNVLVDFPEGGRAGLYVDAVRCGQANPSPERRGILYLHPRSIAESAGLTHSVILNGPSPVLRLGVCGNRDPDGDWLLVVNVDGARLGAERLIRGSDGWQDLVYDLSGFSTGEPILICVETRANDWQRDYAFIDYIRIEDEAGAEPQAEPAVVRVERVIVEDNFDSENGGTGRIGYEDFQNWYVRGGDVDLVGHGLRDTHPNHGLYVDMDGGGYTAGTLQSKGAYRLSPGLYRLRFDLAGDPERTRNTMTVSLGKLFSESFTLEAREPFQTFSREIPVVKTVNASLVFKQAGRDRGGFLLDNLSLAAISYPGAGFLPVRPTAYLGLRVTKWAGVGFDIVDVTQGSPAENAGLQKGDLILSIDGGTLADADMGESQFAEMVSALPCDQLIRLTIQRNGNPLDIWVRPKPKE